MKPSSFSEAVKDIFSAYELADIAACDFAAEVMQFRKSLDITTVDGQREYDLPPDFIKIAVQEKNWRKDVILYTKSGETQGEAVIRDPRRNFWDYDTDLEQQIPGSFDIIPKSLAPTNITGVTTSAGTESNLQATLNDTGATFTDGSDLVYPRYRVRNSTPLNESRGVVIERSSDIKLVTSISLEGAARGWASGDSYVIQSSCKFQLILDYASNTSGDKFTIDYYCFPSPVFSPYAQWGFPNSSDILGLAAYVTWLLKIKQIQEVAVRGNYDPTKLQSDKMYLLYRDCIEKALLLKQKQFESTEPSILMRVL
uniref:Uncharacterized protein n=1 Tax=viral metagenome TaxID=1070528 RepID=A0A6M3IFU5_9ZZZZ